jgi:aspartyl-tRNA(Asn)/glutamyl-tRNA(Gln) amidotransferase subunit C
MISKEDIKKLAELARINLTGEEEEKLKGELESILGYMGKLKEVDISNVPEMTHALLEEQNVFRADEINKNDKDDKSVLLTGQFPEEERGYLKVKSVFD